MINVNKLKKVKSNFPVMVGKGAISKKDCEKLMDEIQNAKSFDDLIQGGRNRINKGSSNFKNYLKKSLPLLSITINAGKFSTSIFQTASIPNSGYSKTDTFLIEF